MKLGYLTLVVILLAGVLLWACDDELTNGGCDSGYTQCGDVCCPNDNYTCSGGECVLAGCDAGLYLCGPGCPFGVHSAYTASPTANLPAANATAANAANAMIVASQKNRAFMCPPFGGIVCAFGIVAPFLKARQGKSPGPRLPIDTPRRRR
jgi:hypothetical protein